MVGRDRAAQRVMLMRMVVTLAMCMMVALWLVMVMLFLIAGLFAGVNTVDDDMEEGTGQKRDKIGQGICRQ